MAPAAPAAAKIHKLPGVSTPPPPLGPRPRSRERWLAPDGSPYYSAAGVRPGSTTAAKSGHGPGKSGGSFVDDPSLGGAPAPGVRLVAGVAKTPGLRPPPPPPPTLPRAVPWSKGGGTPGCASVRPPVAQPDLIQALAEFEHATVLVLELFAGCGPFNHILGSFESARGKKLLGHNVVVLSFEICDYARRVLDSRGQKKRGHILSGVPDSAGKAGSVLALVEKDASLLEQIYQALPNLKLSATLSGSPCKDVSLAKRNGAGPTGPQSFLMWAVAATVQRSRDILSTRTPAPAVAFCAENVHTKPEWRILIDTLFGVPGLEHDAAIVGPSSRRRVTNANFTLGELPQSIPWIKLSEPRDCLEPGWAPAWELLSDFTGEKKFATFTTAWEPGSLSEYRGATKWHLALVAYTPRGLVYRVGASEQRLADLKSLLERNQVSQTDVKRAGSHANLVRIAFVEKLLHTDLGSDLRALNAVEKEKCLGYPPGSTLPDGPVQAEDDLARSTMAGNSWSLLAFKKLLDPLLTAMASPDPSKLRCTGGAALARTATEALAILQPPALGPRPPQTGAALQSPAAAPVSLHPLGGQRRRPQRGARAFPAPR